MDPSDSFNVNDLFDEAADEGSISQSASQSLRMVDLNDQIAPALAENIEDLMVTEQILVGMLFDNSGSIRFSNNTQLVRNGHNDIVDKLRRTTEQNAVMMHSRLLNPNLDDGEGGRTDILYPFMPVHGVPLMDQHNFNPNGGTPLYDQMAVMLGTIQAETQRFARLAIPCRSITVFITDGADLDSNLYSPSTIRPIVQSMLAEEFNIVAAIGVQDDIGTDFRAVFADCGLLPDSILTPDNIQDELTRAFAMTSQSISQASQPGLTSSQVRGNFQWD